MSTTRAAYDAVHALYLKRVCGMTIGEYHYDGPIDVELIASAAPLPASNSLDDHRRAWAKLREIFREETGR